jgi:hypothetical protein
MSNFDLNDWVKANKQHVHKSAENIAVEHIFKNKINEMRQKEKEMVTRQSTCQKPFNVLPHSQDILYPHKTSQPDKVIQPDIPDFKKPVFDSNKGKWFHDVIHTHPYKKTSYKNLKADESPKYRDQVTDNEIFDEQKWLSDKLYTNSYDKKKYKSLSSKSKSKKYNYDNVDEMDFQPLENNDLNIEPDTKALGAFTTQTSTLFNNIVKKISNGTNASEEANILSNPNYKYVIYLIITIAIIILGLFFYYFYKKKILNFMKD